MSAQTAERRVALGQAGVGPAGMAVWFSAKNIRIEGDLTRDGVAVYEKGSSSDVGKGTLKFYPGVQTNSAKKDVTSSLPPAIRKSLANTAAGRRLADRRDHSAYLADVVDIQAEKARHLRELLGDHLVTGVEISKLIEVKERGANTYLMIDSEGNLRGQADVVLISTGGEERIDPYLNTPRFRDKTLLAGEVIGNLGSSERTDALLKPAKRVAIAGAGHSGGLIVGEVIERSDAEIDLIHRGDILIHSKSMQEALDLGLPVTDEALRDDPQGIQPWRARGARGPSAAWLRKVLLNQEPRVTKYPGSLEDYEELLEKVDVIIPCTGLKWRPIPFYREDDKTPVGFLQNKERVVINHDGNPYALSEDSDVYIPVKQVFVVGAGSIGVTPDVQNFQAINFYEGTIGEFRAAAISGALRRISNARAAALAS
jgi:hypothetical protein